jgi:hypothetical protein
VPSCTSTIVLFLEHISYLFEHLSFRGSSCNISPARSITNTSLAWYRNGTADQPPGTTITQSLLPRLLAGLYSKMLVSTSAIYIARALTSKSITFTSSRPLVISFHS